MIEDSLGTIILAVAALVVSIVSLAKLTGVKATIEQLKQRLGELERGGAESPAPKPVSTKAAVPPPLPAYVTHPQAATPGATAPVGVPPKPHRQFNWESILGVKLFAWIGGFAFFLGVVFFVKYAFENNWITPAMRILAGAIIGALLIVVSLLPRVRCYRVPAQSLCATGILILYADVYAAHVFYGLIPLTATIAVIWVVTAVALGLAHYLSAQSVAWLALFAGFVTPILFRRSYASPFVLFGYTGVLSCAAAAIGALKRCNYLLIIAAIGSVALEFAWAAGVFGEAGAQEARVVFLVNQALFLAICIALDQTRLSDNWIIAAGAIVGSAALLAFDPDALLSACARDSGFLTLLLGAAGLIALAVVPRRSREQSKASCAIVAIALGLIGIAEWRWYAAVFLSRGLDGAGTFCGFGDTERNIIVILQVAIFFLFAGTPYLYDTKRLWPWIIAAIAGPLQFWFVYSLLEREFYRECLWLLPLAFALPAAGGVLHLVRREDVDIASGDSRLATQGAAVVAFVSLVFPVQFHREWITLGWAIEGLLLLLLFRWIPNRRLRAVSLVIFTGAFLRLALNPAVFSYHPRTHTPIFNWYLYAYGIAAICLFLGARWFGEPKENFYERKASAFLYWTTGIVLFLLMNIEIADYFSVGPTLTFSFTGNFARDMTYTIAWSLFAFGLVVLGIVRNVRNVRLVGIGLLCLAFAKLFLHDLDSLEQLYRIAALIAVALIAIVASFVYQRFLLPGTKA